MNPEEGVAILQQWLDEQKAKAVEVEAKLKNSGVVCQSCGNTLRLCYGRHSGTFFFVHQNTNCTERGRTWHFGARTEEEAIASFVPDP